MEMRNEYAIVLAWHAGGDPRREVVDEIDTIFDTWEGALEAYRRSVAKCRYDADVCLRSMTHERDIYRHKQETRRTK